MKPLKTTLALYCLLILLSATTPTQTKAKSKIQPKEIGLQSINLKTSQAIIQFLASDELQGREAGHQGSYITSQYIVSQLKTWGIQPLHDSYFQSFEGYSSKQKNSKRYWVNPDSIQKIKQGEYRQLSMRNVLAMIPGKNSKEYIIVGAHFDHLGIDETLEGDKIYNGADDNASGVSAVLQIARAFSLSGQQPERNLIFAFWDGEEKGILGSEYFVRTCPFINQIKGYLNFDMIGRNSDPENPPYFAYIYTEAHPAFGEWLKEDMKKYKFNLDPNYRPWENPVGGSDNTPFAKKKIPVIWYHTERHPDLHKPSDQSEKINYDKVMNITKAAFLSVWNLTNSKSY